MKIDCKKCEKDVKVIYKWDSLYQLKCSCQVHGRPVARNLYWAWRVDDDGA